MRDYLLGILTLLCFLSISGVAGNYDRIKNLEKKLGIEYVNECKK